MRKVTTGQLFRPRADDWNAFIDAAEAHRRDRLAFGAGGDSRGFRDGTVQVHNTTSHDWPHLSVVWLGGLVDPPVDEPSENRFQTTLTLPLFELQYAWQGTSGGFAILQEPLPQGRVGAARVNGITPVQVTVSDESHRCARPDMDEYYTPMVSDHWGPCRIIWKESGTGRVWAVVAFSDRPDAPWRLGVAWDATASEWTVSASGWPLPPWLQWAGASASSCTIPGGDLAGIVYVQCTRTPAMRGWWMTPPSTGTIRLIADISGSTPHLNHAATLNPPTTGGGANLPCELLYLPVAEFSGSADGTYTLTPRYDLGETPGSFEAFRTWMSMGIQIQHGQSGGDVFVRLSESSAMSFTRYLDDDVGWTFYPYGSAIPSGTFTPESPAGFGQIHQLHCDESGRWTHDSVHSDGTFIHVRPRMFTYSHDGHGNLLQAIPTRGPTVIRTRYPM